MTRVQLLIGTRKGAWIYTSDEQREVWTVSEPIMPGWSVYHAEADARGGDQRLYLAANHWAWGPCVAKSVDGGTEWDWNSTGLGFPPDMAGAIGNIWEVRPGHRDEPGVVYAGTQPAGLFRSADYGASWAPIDGLNRHAHRGRWGMSGGGDSCLHSIEIDPRDSRHMWIAISSGGSYETRDGGDTWTMFSHGVIPTTAMARTKMQELLDMDESLGQATVESPADQFPPQEEGYPDLDPMAMNEMHKMRLDQKNPSRLWTASHIGVYRSDDEGANWVDVTEGLPSVHGFPMAVTRAGKDAAFVVPLEFEANNFRVVPGQFTVYRTQDSGTSWEALTNGLPGPHDYQSVYRNAMDTDSLDNAGVYVGTTNGEVYASADTGDHWQRLPGTLPPILSVTACIS